MMGSQFLFIASILLIINWPKSGLPPKKRTNHVFKALKVVDHP